MARIGMVSIWFHRGQSEVSRTLRQALIDNGHEVFIFGRMGGIYSEPKQERDDPYWQLPNIEFYDDYAIPTKVLMQWALTNKLDAVVFNEEYDFGLPQAIRALRKKTIHYVDFIHPDWKLGLRQHYHQLWSATHRTTKLLADYGLADTTRHIAWGLHPSIAYLGDQTPAYDFFHNAGWLGINFRKGTDLVIQAFDKLTGPRGRYSLLVHAQVPSQMLSSIESLALGMLMERGLTWRHETVPSPGLYHLGRVVVQPSRLEGLGLTIPEAMYQGRAVITTDAPPMNEFVTAPHLVPIASTNLRADGLSFPECVADVDLLAERMQASLHDYQGYGLNNFSAAQRLFAWSAFCDRIKDSLEAIGL